MPSVHSVSDTVIATSWPRKSGPVMPVADPTVSSAIATAPVEGEHRGAVQVGEGPDIDVVTNGWQMLRSRRTVREPPGTQKISETSFKPSISGSSEAAATDTIPVPIAAANQFGVMWAKVELVVVVMYFTVVSSGPYR